MSNFDLCVSIDYSGAQTPTSRLKGLQVYAAQPGGVPPLTHLERVTAEREGWILGVL